MTAALALLLAALLDRCFGEPRNAWHPVAWLGRLIGLLGRWLPAGPPPRALVMGGLAWGLIVGGVAALAWGLEQGLARLPLWAALPLLALLLKPALAWRMLRDEVAAVEAALGQSLEAGRTQVGRLCSRDASQLDAGLVRETAIESLAENLNDAWVAPLFWFLVAGLPGAWAWRTVNTLDACWGYRGPRWEWAGKLAARADDLGAWLPARLSAFLLAPAPKHWASLRREAARTPSPNGGWPMAAMALRLGIRLRKPGVYALNAEARAPVADDSRAALRIGGLAAWLALLLAMLVAMLEALPPMTARVHGGPDALGEVQHDLSTGSHPAGANALALQHLAAAAPQRYPDPGYHALKAELARFHGVPVSRLLMAASASEFIQRMTAVSGRLRPGAVRVPEPAYGDYAHAARAWGREARHQGPASLRWWAEPGSPDGRSHRPPSAEELAGGLHVLDLAYAPLRLDGRSGWPVALRDQVFQLITPNKALGLCGVRAAFAIAPQEAPQDLMDALRAAEPSWALGVHGVALLNAWCDARVQALLQRSLSDLRAWRAELVDGLGRRGFRVAPGTTPFVMAALPGERAPSAAALRWQGVAVRDLASFGLPAHWRVNAGPPEALAALWRALDSCQEA